MSDLIIRTEDIKTEEILGLYVESSRDKRIVDTLKSPNPIVLEGSRGTGKSFLLRVAEAQLLESFSTDRVIPAYLTFSKSSLIQTNDPQQFQHWMMAKICSRVTRALYLAGLLVKTESALSIITGGAPQLSAEDTPLEQIAKAYEESYKRPGSQVDATKVPNVEDFRDAIEDICRSRDIKRFAIFIDEAAHIFRPEQQRQFFTLFRDLRSPYLSCNAAVYPGVTAYGQTFQATHDALIEEINRDVLDPDYLVNMREIVFKQADATLMADITTHGENFNALAYAVSGNPRLLLKTIGKAPRLRTTDVEKVLKDFYRTEIWTEHSGLCEKYAGHRGLIDWGRKFVEETVIPDARAKNDAWLKEAKNESTCFFWIHRDAPESVNEALRLLTYTGIVSRIDAGVVATRKELGTRYAVNLGCLAAAEPKPIAYLTHIGRSLSIKRFAEFGANHNLFRGLVETVGQFKEADISEVLALQLEKSVDVLELSDYQKTGLKRIGLDTIGKALNASEAEFQKILWVGPKRSRRMMNVVVASILEYLSG